MPSLRLLSVAALAGLGAVVAVAGSGGVGKSDEWWTSRSAVRGSLIIPSPPASSPSPAPSPAAPGGLDVRAENERAGASGWRIDRARGTAGGLAAYAGAVSVDAGTPVPLFVRGEGSVRVRALRIGWYGGAGARQVWVGTLRAGAAPGDPAGWPARGYADTVGWPEGHYLLRLDLGRASRYVPLTVRSPGAAGRVVVLAPALSWQADNTRPARPVASFDRPYVTGFGAGGFLAGDAGVVQSAERTGRPLAYLTDVDVSADPGLLAGAAGVVTGGDSRFWTPELRSALTRAATSGGTGLAFFGAGAGSRTVTLPAGDREVRIRTGAAVAAAAEAGLARLTGLRPGCPAAPGLAGVSAGWVVSDAGWWGYRGTGVRFGDAFPGLVGGRVDEPAPGFPGSSGSSGSSGPSEVAGRVAGTRTGCGTRSVTQAATYGRSRSGADLFAAGTARWACALVNPCIDRHGRTVPVDRRSRRFADQVTRNVVNHFAVAARVGRHGEPAGQRPG